MTSAPASRPTTSLGDLPRSRRLVAGAVTAALSLTGLLVSPAAPALSQEPGPGAMLAAGATPRSAPVVPVASVAPVAPRGDYGWPTGALAVVLEGFDPPAVRWGRGHRGVDLSLTAGSPVLAAADGTVVFAGQVAGRPVVSIDHGDGVRTTYEPVEPGVVVGEVVSRGQVIGTLLAGHREDGADALHWGARTGRDEYVDPLRLVRPPVIRLKPVLPED